MSSLTETQRRLAQHLESMAQAGRPFEASVVARETGRTVRLVNKSLRELESAGAIGIETRRVDSTNWRRITIIETGQVTPWPCVRSGDLDTIESDTRSDYLAWRERSGWSHAQVAAAARALVSASFGDYPLSRFAAGHPMNYQYVKELRRFMTRFPYPAPYHEWRAGVAREMARVAHASHDRMIARLEDLDQQRARRRQELLARERAAFDRTRRQQEDEFRLDRATIAALSGGTMTGGVRI